MYERDTNSVIVNAINDTYTGTPLTISCEKCNSAVSLDTPDDIAYLYRLAQESPLLYAELACKCNRKWYFENCYGALDDEGEDGGLDEDS